MGLLKFRLNPPELSDRLPDLRKAYITGPDRTPGRAAVDVRPGLLTINRPGPESGRGLVPRPAGAVGMPVVATATLADRAEPYDLGVELARGRLNDVRNQAADWKQLGLVIPAELEEQLRAAQRAFARAVTAREDPAAAASGAGACLEAA